MAIDFAALADPMSYRPPRCTREDKERAEHAEQDRDDFLDALSADYDERHPEFDPTARDFDREDNRAADLNVSDAGFRWDAA